MKAETKMFKTNFSLSLQISATGPKKTIKKNTQ